MSDNTQSASSLVPVAEQPQLTASDNISSTSADNTKHSRKRKRDVDNKSFDALSVTKGIQLESGPSARTRSRLRLLNPQEDQDKKASAAKSRATKLHNAEPQDTQMLPRKVVPRKVVSRKVKPRAAKSRAAQMLDAEAGGIELDTLETGDSEPPTRKTGQHKKSSPKVPTKADPSELHHGKPLPLGTPEVWAEHRAALCDALDYYCSHQGSLYTKKGVPLGMLIDSKVGDEDVFSSQVIITSVGGGCASDNKTGKVARVESLSQDTNRVQYLLNAKKLNQAIVVIAGMGNKLWPSVPPHYYNVLDHFQVTDVWPVKSTNPKDSQYVGFMVRFEKINLSSKSWWTPIHPTTSNEYQVGEYVCPSKSCKNCKCVSKEKYNLGWACLNDKCAEFFKFSQSTSNGQVKLDYNKSFLNERTKFESTEPLTSLVPELPTANTDNAFGTGGKAKRGIVCPLCRRCSRRLKWGGWVCESDNCNFQHTIPFTTMTSKDVEKETQSFKGTQLIDTNVVSQYHSEIGGYQAELYYLIGENEGELAGAVTVFRATKAIRSKSQGPDELFKEIQQADLGLRRNSALHSGAKSEEVTSHFQSNWGAYYKFGVVVKGTRGFDEAPAPILKALHRLTWAGKAAINTMTTVADKGNLEAAQGSMPPDFVPFNELLSLGYFATSAINYHDDGEKELSPTVATLSLGSPATMRFRPKYKVNIGELKVKKNKTTKNKTTKNKTTKKEVLTFKLNHGDMVVMHGTNIHKYYEHEVKPGGQLRYALTCRHILLDRMDDDERRHESSVKGKIPEGSYVYRYDGERNNDTSQPADATDNPSSVTATAEQTSTSAESLVEQIPSVRDRSGADKPPVQGLTNPEEHFVQDTGKIADT